MRTLKPLFVMAIAILSVFSINAQENINLTAPQVSPAPLQPVEDNGTGCYSFLIQNVNGGYETGSVEIGIVMQNITPPNGTGDLTSDLGASTSWSWTYDASLNTFSGTQTSPIGFLYSEEITVCFDVTGNSLCPVEENGFTATGYIMVGEDGNATDNIASSFTCTSEALTLPVELTSFNATKNGKVSVLDWTTANEINNSHFDIERSSDGIRYSKIGEVEGKGNTNSKSDYSFVDESPVTGTNYYRLNQKDYDGKSTLSEIRILSFEAETSASKIQIFPNPVIDYVQIESNVESTTLKVYDVSGKLAYSRSINAHGIVNTNDFTAGTYIFNVIDNGGNIVHTEKILVNK